MKNLVCSILLAIAFFYGISSSYAEPIRQGVYNIGNPILSDIWVDPVKGNDSNSGTSRNNPLKSLREAWNRIPSDTELTSTGYRIFLTSGNYTEDLLPNSGWMEGKYGTYNCPIIIQSVDGDSLAYLQDIMNIYDCRYLYLIGLKVHAESSNVVHLASCENILLRYMEIIGAEPETYLVDEALKVNQCQYIYIENSDISGASENAIDFVAVQHGRVQSNILHNTGDWGIYLKGGSAYFEIAANEIFDCGTGGFSAGQGTGFEFMVSPWLHYEAYDIKFVNNIIHDTDGAGMGVNGGYNILLAYNTLYRIGRRSHVIEVVFGLRGCDGNTTRCNEYLSFGGWGTSNIETEEPIPNRNIYIYNNIVYNPSGYRSGYQHFAIYGPRSPSSGTNIPSPVCTDTNLQIKGNIIWNGPVGFPIGIEEPDQGCQPSNPTCNLTKILSENYINTLEPQLSDPEIGDFTPVTGSNVLSAATYSIPNFLGGDLPSSPSAPEGNFENTVSDDKNGNIRSTTGPPGAYILIEDQGHTTWYLAEGCTLGSFDEWILVQNPNSTLAECKITFMRSNGNTAEHTFLVGSFHRYTIHVNDYVPSASVSAKVESTNGVGIFVERAMYWDSAATLPSSAEGFTARMRWAGGHCSNGITSPSLQWYFAEGCTANNFDEWILVQNPNSTQAECLVTFMKQDGSTLNKSISVPATSRYTIHANNEIPSDSFSIKIESLNGVGIIAERAMYWSCAATPPSSAEGQAVPSSVEGRTVIGCKEGHCSAGVTGTSTTWYLAEGCTMGSFDEWILIQNPGDITANIKITFMKSNGTNVFYYLDVSPTSRKTIYANNIVPNDSISAKIESTNGIGIIVERAMYWDCEATLPNSAEGGGVIEYSGGHNSTGVISPVETWYLAEGCTVGSFDDWVMIQNPNNSIARVTVVFMKDTGSVIVHNVEIAPLSRYTIRVNDIAPNASLSAKITCTNGLGIIVERAMYWDSAGYSWIAGHNSGGMN